MPYRTLISYIYQIPRPRARHLPRDKSLGRFFRPLRCHTLLSKSLGHQHWVCTALGRSSCAVFAPLALLENTTCNSHFLTGTTTATLYYSYALPTTCTVVERASRRSFVRSPPSPAIHPYPPRRRSPATRACASPQSARGPRSRTPLSDSCFGDVGQAARRSRA
jgi:hypothetical protein